MINENFTVKVNKDAERYEFKSKTDRLTSYTVGFSEVDCLEDAYIAVWKALKIDFPDLTNSLNPPKVKE